MPIYKKKSTKSYKSKSGTAKKAETIVYNNMKKYHGTNKVRGAGHTKRFSYG